VPFPRRIDAQLKVPGHRVEAQAVEDILQTQFSEIKLPFSITRTTRSWHS
jgi:hypothetical protein